MGLAARRNRDRFSPIDPGAGACGAGVLLGLNIAKLLRGATCIEPIRKGSF
jgi:hypothetical protein